MDYATKAAPSYPTAIGASQSAGAERMTELSTIGNELNTCDLFVGDLLNRMDASLDRILGSRPQDVAKDGGTPHSNSHVGSIRNGLSGLQAKAKRFSDLVERLESIG